MRTCVTTRTRTTTRTTTKDDDEDEDKTEDKDEDEDEEKDEDEDERCGAVGRARACGDAHDATNITSFARHAHVTRERMTCGVM